MGKSVYHLLFQIVLACLRCTGAGTGYRLVPNGQDISDWSLTSFAYFVVSPELFLWISH